MDDLFFEYIRILRDLKPKVFIAENVKGLISGVAKGLFKIILNELKNSGYNVRVQLMDAKWLGVPQKRQRVIFIGTRNDLPIKPVFPLPFKYQYTGADALYDFIYTEEKTTSRKLTIDECKRICSFPDDFNLDGKYNDQWARLGNAVPPLMMKAIACTIRDVIQPDQAVA
jgi:site-specific DNA-cytosine methylase